MAVRGVISTAASVEQMLKMCLLKPLLFAREHFFDSGPLISETVQPRSKVYTQVWGRRIDASQALKSSFQVSEMLLRLNSIGPKRRFEAKLRTFYPLYKLAEGWATCPGQNEDHRCSGFPTCCSLFRNQSESKRLESKIDAKFRSF